MADEAAVEFRAAVRDGVVGEAERMLDEDPSLINDRDPSSQATPLMVAAQAGHVGVVRLLLRRGADINFLGGRGETALTWAAKRGHLEVVGVLLKNGADSSLSRGDGWSPLMYASSRGHLAIVERLLQYGADDCTIACWLACRDGRHQVLETLLLVARVDPTIADDGGVTPRQAAKWNRQHRVLEMLDWYDGELERAYFLARARDMVDDSDTISKAPEKAKASTADEAQHAREEAAPVHLKGRVERGGELPVVEVAVMPRRSKRRMGCEAVSLMEEEEQRRAALEYTVKWMKRDLFEVLMQMMRYR